MSTLDVSVVIVSFNTCAVTRECLQSLRQATGSLAVQTIVVDNNSHDGSAEMIEREFPEVLLIRSKTNLGFGPANNEGFRHASGRYIVLLNTDAFLDSDALRISVEKMDANPGIGLGGARLIGRDGSAQPSARMFPTVFSDLLVMSGLAARYSKSRFFGRADRTWANPMEAAEVDWVPGAYSILRAEALKKVNGFDPRFFLYYEEVDLCLRIKNAGYSIWYWPQVVVVHIGGESSRQMDTGHPARFGSQLTLWRYRSMMLYYRKHHGPAAWFAMLTEGGWCVLRYLRRSLSFNSEVRASAPKFLILVSMMKQAWADTRGGRLSPIQPW